MIKKTSTSHLCSLTISISLRHCLEIILLVITIAILNMKMPHQLLILVFSQSDYLIKFVDTNSHTYWQTVQIQISWLWSQLICIYTVCKGRRYPGSAGLGLNINTSKLLVWAQPIWSCTFSIQSFGSFPIVYQQWGQYGTLNMIPVILYVLY